MLTITTDRTARYVSVTLLGKYEMFVIAESEIPIFSSGASVTRFLKPQTPIAWEMQPATTASNVEDSAYSDQSVNGWISQIRDALYSIPSVESIYVSIQGEEVDIWVVIPKRDIGIVRQIAECQGRFLKMLALDEHSPFVVDFHVVYREGRSEEDLLPTRAFCVPRQV